MVACVDMLTPRTEKEAYSYYSLVLNNGLYTIKRLKEIYDDYELHRDSWKKASKRDKYGERDYISYCNSQRAMKKILEERGIGV